jgi:hypothetical protein
MVMCHKKKKPLVSDKSSQIYQVHFWYINYKIMNLYSKSLECYETINVMHIEFMVILNTNFLKLLCNESYNIFVILSNIF